MPDNKKQIVVYAQPAPKKKEKKKGSKKKPGAAGVAMLRARGLDAAGLAWMKLLADPCGAAMTFPCFNSAGSGYLMKTTQIVEFGGNSAAVSGLSFFTPGMHADQNATLSMWCHAYSNTAGGLLGTATATSGPAFLGSANVNAYRAVAGCLKLRYSGTEMDRKGIVYTYNSPQQEYKHNDTGLPSVDSIIPNCIRSKRLGEEEHEVRWIPQASGDQNWTMTNTGGPGVASNSHDNTTIGFVVRGAPAGTLFVEATFVWEWVPGNYSGLRDQPQANRSSNTVGQVLSAVGSISNFISDPAVHGRIAGTYQFAKSAFSTMSRMGGALPLLMG